jgi:excinuclease ABC subunit C
VAAPLILPVDSPVRHLVTRVRDEAHRHALGYHRSRRRKRTLVTALTVVRGIGPLRARSLLRAFGSVEGVRSASADGLAGVVGNAAARAVREHLAAGGEGVSH